MHSVLFGIANITGNHNYCSVQIMLFTKAHWPLIQQWSGILAGHLAYRPLCCFEWSDVKLECLLSVCEDPLSYVAFIIWFLRKLFSMKQSSVWSKTSTSVSFSFFSSVSVSLGTYSWYSVTHCVWNFMIGYRWSVVRCHLDLMMSVWTAWGRPATEKYIIWFMDQTFVVNFAVKLLLNLL